jgi:hypothetical protein
MSKQQHRAFANDAKSSPETAPQISNTPVITGTGSVYWNVRDIVFGPNRATPDSQRIKSDDLPKQK